MNGPGLGLPEIRQDPRAVDFVQDPYPCYDRIRAAGPVVFWHELGLPVSAHAATVAQILRDRRLGRAAPPDSTPEVPPHLAPFYQIEDHSMLELEPPRHTRLRAQVLRAFTSRRIAGLAPEIAALADGLAAALPRDAAFDLLPAFAQPLPVIVIARLLGVPESDAPDLLRWSHAMVALYQTGRSREIEVAAARAAAEFAQYLRDQIALRRSRPADDLITQLLAAESEVGAEGSRLSPEETVATCALLLNAGHEATVHTIGNGVKTLLEARGTLGAAAPWLAAEQADATVEEILRHDPPLHLFTRWVYEEVEIGGVTLPRGARIGCLLAGAGRDPGAWDRPARFLPERPPRTHLAFGGGIHFCLGAPLARLELRIALERLVAARPGLRLAAPPRYADSWHFHGLERLMLAG